MKKNFLFSLLFLVVQLTFAQTKTITGTVKNKADGIPIPGVTILIKGTKTSTVTDFDGKYSINANTDDVLSFSYVGYETKDVRAGDATNVDLAEATSKLDEVVVVGFSSQKKANLTGAVAKVDVKKALGSIPITDITRGLQGTTPGLNISFDSGNIGKSSSVNIRGAGTIVNGVASGSPLVLIDGVPGDLSLLNAEDVESMSVLKDAASASIYGARAAFGVILITTKNGKNSKGKVRFSYSNNIGWSNPISLVEFNDPTVELPVMIQAQDRAGNANPESFGMNYKTLLPRIIEWKEKYGSTRSSNDKNMILGEDFDVIGGREYFFRIWDPHAEMLKKNAIQTLHNLSAQGSLGEKSSFIASLSLANQEGVMKINNETNQRINLNLGFTTQLASWLTGDFKVLGSFQEYNSPFNYYNSGLDTAGNGYFGYYMRWGSYFPYGTYNGTYFRHAPGYMANASQNESKSNDIRLSGKLTAQITKDFNIIGEYSVNNNFSSLKQNGGQVPLWDWWSGAADLVAGKPTSMETANDFVAQTKSSYIRNVANIYANYTKRLGENHNFKVLGGLNSEWYDFERTYARRNTLLDKNKPEFNLAIGDQFTSPLSSNAILNPGLSRYAIAGFFARVNYDYKGKYLLEVNGRYDGSSKFPTDEQWGFFPSASVGYRISEEGFMESTRNWLNDLKIRGSIGSIGNQNIAANAFLPTMSNSNPFWVGSGVTVPPSVNQPSNVDPDLTWEKVTTQDIGIDIRVLDMLGLSFDYYQRDTKGMLAPGKTLPGSFGQAAASTNSGNLRTTGWELALNFNKQINKNISVYADLTLSDNTTEVTEWNNSSKLLGSFYAGQKLGEIWGLETDRLIQSTDQIDATGLIINGVDYKNIRSGVFKYGAGDVMYKDLNGDGVISRGDGTAANPGDLKVIGNTTPRYQYGVRLGGALYGFDIDAFFQGVGKREYWTTSDLVLPFYNRTDAMYENMNDYWTPTNTEAHYPNPYVGHAANAFGAYAPGSNNFVAQSRYLLDMSYLRLKSVTLGYTLPKSLAQKIGMDKIRPYVSGLNLATWKSSKLPVDPEINETEAVWGRTFPYSKTWSVGIQLAF
ncbi:SusC/RagA family TonB-linked outer membrane protein [Flavobacterium sp. GA093]|uniref:SusC/RagA family TonB-linked outer membrane protein n=1 Tax=Flavobacterium hydrocarbonoxydans TaxID=2683249 RepID=A0A6I4NR32_9FLAO|nr:TonB-dependent receptor [Flavobacterium hydrocarbonoxydans]MWB95442.1 SusC/RagA family TonB-linked outer membrane protein [Flavobacterium hydrocarbonoxydans]